MASSLAFRAFTPTGGAWPITPFREVWALIGHLARAPTDLDNGIRSPRALLAALVRKLVAALRR